MPVTKNLVDYVAVPKEEINLNVSQMTTIKTFLKDLNAQILKDWYNFVDADEDIEISISKMGIVAITLRIDPEETQKAIALLDKISKKIGSHISDKDFSINLSILEKRKIDLKQLIGKEIDVKEFRSMNFKIAPEIKTKISRFDEEHVISFRDIKDVNRPLDIYSSILNGKELRDLIPTEVDVTIAKFVF